MSWEELTASIVANTSMTPTDIGNLSYPELEALLDGMTKNSEREKAQLEGGTTTKGDADDLLDFIGTNGGGF